MAYVKRWVRRWGWIVLIVLFVAHMWSDPGRRETLLLILYLLGQLLFAILFMIIQFVALFWFLSRVKVNVFLPGQPNTLTLDDYYGNEHLVGLMREWVEIIRQRDKLLGMGGVPIRGILLAGPPGVGKTYLIRCLAGSAGIPVIAMEASTIRGMFWGMDVLRVMWFFRKARRLARDYGACIAFIDEIDAIGMSRGGVMGGSVMGPGGIFGWGGSGALTRLLYELDGIEDPPLMWRVRNRFRALFGLPPIPYRDWVIIVGATNRPDVLDPALTRPGRLDRVIHVHMPDRQDRLAMIRGYLSRIRHNLTEDHIERLADLTAGVSPAHIASLITKDAVRYAVVRGRECVEWQDFMRALDEARYGLADPIRQMDERQRWAIAVHEAGHAVFAFRLLPDERIVKASILRRTGLAQALGFVDHRPEDETYALPFRKMAAWILVAMAGDAAVRVLLGEPWSGASSDYEHVRSMVRYMAKSLSLIHI